MVNGWKEVPNGLLPDGLKIYRKGSLQCIVGRPDGYYHLSITAHKRWPAYQEIKQARYDLLPDGVHMAMIFPPEAEFVNAHPGCFHLHELRPGEVPADAEGMPGHAT